LRGQQQADGQQKGTTTAMVCKRLRLIPTARAAAVALLFATGVLQTAAEQCVSLDPAAGSRNLQYHHFCLAEQGWKALPAVWAPIDVVINCTTSSVSSFLAISNRHTCMHCLQCCACCETATMLCCSVTAFEVCRFFDATVITYMSMLCNVLIQLTNITESRRRYAADSCVCASFQLRHTRQNQL
jgi:hypothetical protein